MGDVQITERTIHIENVFREKNPKLAGMIPGFVYGYLRKKIHEDEINAILYDNRHLVGLDMVKATLDTIGPVVSSEGLENIPKEKRAIIASNHPLGGIDGLALMQETGKVRKDIVFPVNDILLFLPSLKPLFIPINKHGSNNENIKIIHETFESDKLVLYFPAGLVSRKQKGGIRDLEWKKTFVSKAKQYQRDVIPVHIIARNSNFFYNLARMRKKLGIKANIEMLYLADETFKQKGKKIHIIFGKPIPYETFDKRYNYRVWAEKVKNYSYSLGKGNREPFDPEKY
jgi:putative hemolysin